MKVALKSFWCQIPDFNPMAILGFFVLADALAWLLYGFYTQDILTSRFFHIARDRGFGEIVQYPKFGVMIAVLVRARRQWPSRLVNAWLILFTVMLLDDAIGIHKAIGGWLLPEPSAHWRGLRLKDLAEAAAIAALEGGTFLYMAYCHFREPPAKRVFSWWFIAGLVPVIFSGLGLDIVRVPMLEAAGEMIAMTILLAVVLWRYRVRRDAPPVPAPGAHALPMTS